MKILFIGASGMLGMPVAKELLKAGFELTLLARDEKKMQKIFPGAKIFKGDIMDQASLEKAFTGQQTVYMNLSVNQSSRQNDPQPERNGVINIIAAAKVAGIRRISCISSIIKNYQGMKGFNWWSFSMKNNAIELIKSSGIAYSIFYPSTFMETLDKQMKQGNKLMLAGKSIAPMWFVAAEDYGKQVVKAFQIAGDKNQEYTIQGTAAYTFDEAAKIFLANYSSSLKIMKAPIGLLKFLGIFSPKMKYTANICDALNNYPEKFESEKTWIDLGKPTISLAQYAKAL